MDDRQQLQIFLDSVIAGLIIPVTFTVLTALVAGAVVALLTWSLQARVATAAVAGGVAYLVYFNWWTRKIHELSRENEPIRHEVIFWLNEWRGNAPHQEPMEFIGLTKYQIYNVYQYIADGGDLTYRAMRSLRLKDDQIAELHRKFEKAGLIEKESDGQTAPYVLTERGKRIFPKLATIPSPAEDGGSIWVRK